MHNLKINMLVAKARMKAKKEILSERIKALSISDRLGFHTDEEKKIFGICMKAIPMIAAFAVAVCLMSNSFFAAYNVDASGAEAKFKALFNGLYTAMLPVATALAVVLVAYNILVIMSSKNPRKCDTAFTWIKGVAIAWLFIMMTGVIIKIIMDFFNTASNAGGGIGNGPLFTY